MVLVDIFMRIRSFPTSSQPTDAQPLTDRLVLTIEPLIAERSAKIFEDDDGWTIRTADGGLSAHYEHTVVIREGKPILLTAA